MNSTVPVPETTLSTMLDEIEAVCRDERKPVLIEHSNGRGDMGENYEIIPVINGSAIYTPALVKALRRAMEGFDTEYGPYSAKPGLADQALSEIAAILEGKEQALEEPRAAITKPPTSDS